MLKGIVADISGAGDVCHVVSDFSQCQASQYLLPTETVVFSLLSTKEEFTFTNMALLKLGGESSTTTRKLVERFDYRDNTIKHVQFETAGLADRDCEIKFHIGSERVSIDVAKAEQSPARDFYKVLEILSREQITNELLWEFSTLGMKHASEALHLTENSGQTLPKQSEEVAAWLHEAHKRSHPLCYREVLQAAFRELHIVDKMAQ